MEGLIMGHLLNRTVIIPRFSAGAQTGSNNLKLEAVLDVEYLKKNLEGFVRFVEKEDVPEFDEFKSSYAVIPWYRQEHFKEICPLGKDAFIAKYGDIKEKLLSTEASSDCIRRNSEEDRDIWRTALFSIRSSPYIQSVADEMVAKVRNYKGDGVRRAYACVHARTEADFGALGADCMFFYYYFNQTKKMNYRIII
eukprot:TRINITY_DN8800_c0_g1_i2.p1 TRINITY_DN8800_c0_g1~~TRINITY_DN8800_c0_g1_i2.p1  ORF type:complete len:195 (+),score=35.88 TRINITY_DN8800_c0_g1_i2:3-587(+)